MKLIPRFEVQRFRPAKGLREAGKHRPVVCLSKRLEDAARTTAGVGINLVHKLHTSVFVGDQLNDRLRLVLHRLPARGGEGDGVEHVKALVIVPRIAHRLHAVGER